MARRARKRTAEKSTRAKQEQDHLGRRLRLARTNRGISLGQLAERTGLTKSLLSQVERAVSAPSLSSLRRMAQALEVPISQLLSESHQVGSVVRRANRKEIRWPALKVMYEPLSPDDRKHLQMILVRMDPGGRSADEPTAHGFGEECSLVLTGRVEVIIGNQHHLLEEGDSVSLDRAIPHYYLNPGDTPATYVQAIYPPTF
jgi:transcriptional regulator with XRE-family HTH domain